MTDILINGIKQPEGIIVERVDIWEGAIQVTGYNHYMMTIRYVLLEDGTWMPFPIQYDRD